MHESGHAPGSVKRDCDVAVIGAGVAGLTATAELLRAGQHVICIEATGRVGGRIRTIRDPLAPAPVELGAEFLHGRPREIDDLARNHAIALSEQGSNAVHVASGRVAEEEPVGEIAEEVMSGVSSTPRRDESFQAFLDRSRRPEDTKDWARRHVEGFHAAPAADISAASLKEASEAAERDHGDRTFRIPGGFDLVPLAILRSIPGYPSHLSLHTVAKAVVWKRGSVDIQCNSAVDASTCSIRCRQVIVAIPLGVLQSGAILFDPLPRPLRTAVSSLGVARVYRITFRFQEPFWTTEKRWEKAHFLMSREEPFGTWWPSGGGLIPHLTGWSSGPHAAPLEGQESTAIAGAALSALARMLRRKIPRPASAYFHDWMADPYARGAYSYVPKGSMLSRDELARPIQGTIFLAGEATDMEGRSGTAHGAISSGRRAAKAVLASLKRRS